MDAVAAVYIDGVQIDGQKKCVKRNTEATFTLDIDAPSAGGSYNITIEIKGANTNEIEAIYRGTITVPEPDPVDPTYTVNVEAPGSVDARENFEVRGYASCSDGDCPKKDWRLLVAGETVKSGSSDLADGEEIIKSAGPDGLFINESGSKKVVFEVGSKSATTTVTVNEIDPPYDPLPGDGGGGGGNGDGGRNIPWAAVALAGGLALSGADDGGSPDSVTDGSDGGAGGSSGIDETEDPPDIKGGGNA